MLGDSNNPIDLTDDISTITIESDGSISETEHASEWSDDSDWDRYEQTGSDILTAWNIVTFIPPALWSAFWQRQITETTLAMYIEQSVHGTFDQRWNDHIIPATSDQWQASIHDLATRTGTAVDTTSANVFRVQSADQAFANQQTSRIWSPGATQGIQGTSAGLLSERRDSVRRALDFGNMESDGTRMSD